MSRTLLVLPLLMLAVACTDPGIGAPCQSNADCSDGMICDVHADEGTCQEDHGHGDTHADESGDTHGETGDTEAAGDCASETRDDDFSIGLSKSGAMVSASFVSANPAPPIKGDNSWVLTFTDAQGAPIDDAQIVVIPMMPDHGHGTPVEAVVTKLDNPGEYGVEPVNLFMAGFWDVGFEITVGGQQDQLSFGFCVE